MSKMEHLYGVADDLLLGWQGTHNPMAGIFIAEDIAQQLVDTLGCPNSYDLALATTVSALACRGLKLTYSEVCDMIDHIITDFQNLEESSWIRKRKLRRRIRYSRLA